MIAGQCYVIDCNHGMELTDVPMRVQPLHVGTVLIGGGAWIGCGCKILKDSRIGKGAVIGAGTVVNGVVENHTIFFSERTYQEIPRR